MKKMVSIHIGGFHASRKPAVIETVLGSCVAVCLHDPSACIGGMNHIFLPGRADMKHFDNAARYGVNAMELLVNRIMRLGADDLIWLQRFLAARMSFARSLPKTEWA